MVKLSSLSISVSGEKSNSSTAEKKPAPCRCRWHLLPLRSNAAPAAIPFAVSAAAAILVPVAAISVCAAGFVVCVMMLKWFSKHHFNMRQSLVQVSQ